MIKAECKLELTDKELKEKMEVMKQGLANIFMYGLEKDMTVDWMKDRIRSFSEEHNLWKRRGK